MSQIPDGKAIRKTAGVKADNTREGGRLVPQLTLEIPLLISFPGEPSHDECKTVKVSAWGAILLTSRNVIVDQELVLTDPVSWKQIACHVRYAKSRAQGMNQVGV